MYFTWDWMPVEKDWMVTVRMNWYREEEDDPQKEIVIPDDDYNKLSRAVEEAFGDIEAIYD